MAKRIGSVGGEKFFVYENNLGDYNVVCLLPEKEVFVEVDCVNGDHDRELDGEVLDVVKGRKVSGSDPLVMDDADRRVSCFRCGSVSELDEEFMASHWFTLRVDRIRDDPDSLEDYIDSKMKQGLSALFHSSEEFCEVCLYEMEGKMEVVCDDEFWSWITAREL